MTLEQWQRHENLVQYAHSLLGHPEFQELLKMLSDSHIKNYRPVETAELAPSSHILHLGKIYGYDECLENIEKAAQLRRDVELTATFAVPDHKEPE